MAERTYRQFFRLVTSQVSLWYRDHSTPNPLGVGPDPTITHTVVGDKFSEEGVEVVEDPGDMEKWKKELEEQKQVEDAKCDFHKYNPGECCCNEIRSVHSDNVFEDDE